MTSGRLVAIVLAGGRASRLGGASKPEVRLGGRTLVERVLAAVDAAGAESTVVVGPAGLVDPSRPSTLEDPPFGGPVAGVAAGLAALGPAPAGGGPDDAVLLLACDLPFARSAVGPLLARFAALDADADGACLLDAAGRTQWLAGIYRRGALDRAVGALGGVRGVSVRALVQHLRLVGVTGAEGAAFDVDTWEDLAEASAREHRDHGEHHGEDGQRHRPEAHRDEEER